MFRTVLNPMEVVGMAFLLFFAIVGVIAFVWLVIKTINYPMDITEKDELLPYDWEDPELWNAARR